MAKKKAQHLYELLQQRAQGKHTQAGSEPAKSAPGMPHAPVAPGRKYVSADPKSISPPVPVKVGQEHLLENVITIRRDTAIVGGLLMLIIIVVAFVIGRATAPVADDTSRPAGGTTKSSSEPSSHLPESPADDQENPSTSHGR